MYISSSGIDSCGTDDINRVGDGDFLGRDGEVSCDLVNRLTMGNGSSLSESTSFFLSFLFVSLFCKNSST
jgi:hypothetical protein